MRLPALLFAAAFALSLAAPAAANPRYSSRYGQKCLLCHEDPGGGGMRSPYASEFLVPNEISMRGYDERSAALLDHALSRSVSVGADMRTLASYADKGTAPENFFQMQGDVYLRFQLDARFSAYFERGVSGSYELWASGFVLPASGYFKIGRFTPPYGWRLEDHTAFVRESLGYFTPPAHTDVGIEIGFLPGASSLAFAAMNGAPGALRDSDDSRTYFVRAERRIRIGSARIAVGGSFLEDDGNRVCDRAGGPFASATLGRLTWVGECDWRRDASGEATAFASSHELAARIVRGLDLVATFDFVDPDQGARTGARRRAGIGVDALPFPFLGTLAMVNFHDTDGGADVPSEEFVETLLLFHIFY
ncbi:MAG: hypothetical protein EHM19_05980 [Candidatus Latescibacterota bacterium]|nr:MAG: hypothetical protein EHM19_05980 [Candidatus Latescibacterota bacterium]